MNKSTSIFIGFSLIFGLFVATGHLASAQLVSANSTSNPTKLSIDLKVNGSDYPSPVNYLDTFNVSWTSNGTVECWSYGSYMPVSPGSSLWNNRTLATSGSMSLMAAWAYNGNLSDLRYYSPLKIAVQCWSASGQSVTDEIYLPVRNTSISIDGVSKKDDRFTQTAPLLSPKYILTK